MDQTEPAKIPAFSRSTSLFARTEPIVLHDYPETIRRTPSSAADVEPDDIFSGVASKEPEEVRSPSPEDPKEWSPSMRFYLAMSALAVLTLMVALDGTILAVALPTIARKLHGTAIESFWAGTSFFLCSTVVQPNSASLSHIFGRMPVIMASVMLFFVGVMLAGTAKNFAMLLAGRSIQGLGGGGVLTMTEVVLTDLVPLRYRGQWGGIIGGMWPLGSVCGPIVGGAFAQTQWRWIFWLNLSFIGITIVLVPLALRLNLNPSTVVSKLRRVDWFGSFLFIASTIVPLTWGGVMYPWTSWRILVPLILGLAGLVLFVLFEIYVAVEPMVRLSVFANRTTNLAFFTEMIHGLIMWVVLFYLPLYMSACQGYSAVVSGVATLPEMLTIAPTAVGIGQVITKTGRYVWVIWAGWIVQTLGLGLLILLDTDTKLYQWILICLVSGVGLGILLPGLLFQLQAASKNEEMAFAVAAFIFFRSLGQALGVAIGSVIFQNEMARQLLRYPRFADRAEQLARDATALVEVIRDMPDGTAEKDELRQAYAQSFHMVWIVMCALSGGCLVLTWWVKGYGINVGLETEQSLQEGELKGSKRK